MSQMKKLAIELDYLYEQMEDGMMDLDDVVEILVDEYGFSEGGARRLFSENNLQS